MDANLRGEFFVVHGRSAHRSPPPKLRLRMMASTKGWHAWAKMKCAIEF